MFQLFEDKRYFDRTIMQLSSTILFPIIVYFTLRLGWYSKHNFWLKLKKIIRIYKLLYIEDYCLHINFLLINNALLFL